MPIPSPTTIIQHTVDGDALIAIRRTPHLRIDKPLARSGLVAAMTANGMAVYVTIAGFTDQDGVAEVSLDQLALACGLSRRHLSRAMARLIDGEWVVRMATVGKKSVYQLRPLASSDGGTWAAGVPGGGPPVAQVVNKPGPPAAHTCNNAVCKEAATGGGEGDLFAETPPAAVDAAAAALLLKLGMERAWVEDVGHRFDLARVKQARDYAHKRAKPGGFVGYLRRTLELGYGTKPPKTTPSTPIQGSQAPVPPVSGTPATPDDLLHPQNRPGANAGLSTAFFRRHESRMAAKGLTSSWEVPDGDGV